MKITWLVGMLLVAGMVNGAELRVSTKEPVVVVAPDGWKMAEDRTAMAGFPFQTYRIDAPGERNAGCMVSVLGKGKPQFADSAFLKKLLRGECRPYVNSPEELAKVEVKELKIDGGTAYYASFVDPDLVGKPVEKGNFKVATPMIVSLSGKYLIKATLMSDEIDGADYKDMMGIIKSMKVKKE